MDKQLGREGRLILAVVVLAPLWTVFCVGWACSNSKTFALDSTVADVALGIAGDHVAPLPSLERQSDVAGEPAGRGGRAAVVFAGGQLAGVRIPLRRVTNPDRLGLLWALLFPLLHVMAARLKPAVDD